MQPMLFLSHQKQAANISRMVYTNYFPHKRTLNETFNKYMYGALYNLLEIKFVRNCLLFHLNSYTILY